MIFVNTFFKCYIVDLSITMRDFNATADRLSEQNCSKPEVNATSGSLTSSDGGVNCTAAAPERAYPTNLLSERRYDLAVITCAIIAASVGFSAVLVNRLVRRGGRRVVGMARSALLLNLVAGDWLLAGGSCGTLAVALLGGRWPLGSVGCCMHCLSTMLGHIVSYYTLASFIVER